MRRATVEAFWNLIDSLYPRRARGSESSGKRVKRNERHV